MSVYDIIRMKLTWFSDLSDSEKMNALCLIVMKSLTQTLSDNGISFIPEGTNKTRVVLDQSKHQALEKCIPQKTEISVVWDMCCPDLESNNCQFDDRFMSQLAKLTIRAQILRFLETNLGVLEVAGFIPLEVNTGYLLDEPGNGSNYLMTFTDLHYPTNGPQYVSDELFRDFENEVNARLVMGDIARVLPLWKEGGMDVTFCGDQLNRLVAVVNGDHEFVVSKTTFDELSNMFSELHKNDSD